MADMDKEFISLCLLWRLLTIQAILFPTDLRMHFMDQLLQYHHQRLISLPIRLNSLMVLHLQLAKVDIILDRLLNSNSTFLLQEAKVILAVNQPHSSRLLHSNSTFLLQEAKVILAVNQPHSSRLLHSNSTFLLQEAKVILAVNQPHS